MASRLYGGNPSKSARWAFDSNTATNSWLVPISSSGYCVGATVTATFNRSYFISRLDVYPLHPRGQPQQLQVMFSDGTSLIFQGGAMACSNTSGLMFSLPIGKTTSSIAIVLGSGYTVCKPQVGDAYTTYYGYKEIVPFGYDAPPLPPTWSPPPAAAPPPSGAAG